MKLPSHVLATLDRFVARFPIPHGLVDTPERVHEIEARVREWSNNAVEQVVFEHPDQGYGSKKSSPTNPQTKDGIAQHQNGRLYMWDMVTGAGTGRGKYVAPQSESLDISNQVFIAIEGRNHLGPVAEPVIPVDPTTPPVSSSYETDSRGAFGRIETALHSTPEYTEDRYTGLEARLERIEAAIAAFARQVKDILPQLKKLLKPATTKK